MHLVEKIDTQGYKPGLFVTPGGWTLDVLVNSQGLQES